MNKKIAIIVLFCFMVMGITGYASYIYFQTQEWDNRIYSGITVNEEIDLSGLTKEEAEKVLIEKLENKMLEKNLIIKVEEKEYSISYEDLDAAFDIKKTVEKAFGYGKGLSVLDRYKKITADNGVDYGVEFSYDNHVLDAFINRIKDEYNMECIEPTLTMVKSGEFKVTPEQIGKKLNESKLKELMLSNINGEVEEISIKIDAPVIFEEPTMREELLRSIDSKIAEAKTSYKTSGEARSFNVDLATRTMSHTLILPGERFSFNKVVGERSVERGYKTSKVIINNKLVDGVGGGVCQVSTTLYHAVMKTGLGFYERLNHSLPSSYSELGQDATVAWGAIDYQFTNTFDYPIYVEGYTKDKEVFVNIYSNSSLAGKDYVMVSEIVKVIEPTTKRVEDPEMYIGDEEQVRRPIKGYVVEVYRELRENGEVVSRELISTDKYQVVNEEIKVGTKPREDKDTAENR